jgi:hypothetical protein
VAGVVVVAPPVVVVGATVVVVVAAVVDGADVGDVEGGAVVGTVVPP